MRQVPSVWPAPYVAGVSLTYDGSLPEHLDCALPTLADSGLVGTFFACPENCVLRLPEWRKAPLQGHEIGNGFLHNAVNYDGLVPDWQPETFELELEDAEGLLNPLGKVQSFAYPCVRTEWGTNGMPIVADIVRKTTVRLNELAVTPHVGHYRFRRVPLDGFNIPTGFEPTSIRCIVADELDGDSLCVIAHLGISQGAWTVFVFNSLPQMTFNLEGHTRLVAWLKDHKNAVMIETVSHIAALLSSADVPTITS